MPQLRNTVLSTSSACRLGPPYIGCYSYDTLNRLTSGPGGSYTYGDSAHLDAATAITGSANTYTASYDAAGDMTCRAPTSSTTCSGTQMGAQMSHDNERRLASWQNAPGSTPTSSTAGTTTTTSYYYAGGKRIAQATNGAFSYLGSDNLGSAEVALDGSGNVQASALYDPYGNTRYTSGTMPGSYGYTGQRADNATGLDDYNARYYDPVLGQFASADSTAGDGLNRYAYVGGNPETATDPTGNYRCDDTGCTRGGGNHGSGGCTFDCGGGSSGSSGGGTGGGKGAGSGSAGGGSGSADHNPAPQETSCVGALLVGYCYSLDVAEALGQRINFVEAWFSQFAAGWGTAEAAFMMWMSISGRMAHSPFWEGVDGDLIANMWVAAVEFEAGVRTTGNAIIQNWLSFMATPSTAGFWLAHNGSIMAGAWSSQGLEWFGAEPPQEQLFINDALVNLLEGTYATTLAAQFADSEHLPGWLSGIAHGCDPSTNCIGIFLYALYPTSYPVPWTWFATPFGAADTAYACQAPVMPIAC